MRDVIDEQKALSAERDELKKERERLEQLQEDLNRERQEIMIQEAQARIQLEEEVKKSEHLGHELDVKRTQFDKEYQKLDAYGLRDQHEKTNVDQDKPTAQKWSDELKERQKSMETDMVNLENHLFDQQDVEEKLRNSQQNTSKWLMK